VGAALEAVEELAEGAAMLPETAALSVAVSVMKEDLREAAGRGGRLEAAPVPPAAARTVAAGSAAEDRCGLPVELPVLAPVEGRRPAAKSMGE
jgi:hypothetical protein